MRLGLLSDIHADPLALELAWAHLTVLGADRIVCAGDLVGYGPHPDRAIAFLAEHRIISCLGNHDRWALDRPPGSPDEFGGTTPGPEAMEFLRGLEPYLVFPAGRRIAVVAHGSPHSDMEFVTRATHPPETLRRYLAEFDADLIVLGHTHQPMWYRCARGLIINPASVVSAPVVRSSRTFALVDVESLTPSFFDVESGRPIAVAPWFEDPPRALVSAR